MLNENAKKWVAALRSGEFKQGIGNLCASGRYCCLGVACEVAALSGVPVKKTTVIFGTTFYDGQGFMLPELVKVWLGLAENSGKSRDHKTLWEQNDTECKSFSEIADFIESEPEGLFITPPQAQ